MHTITRRFEFDAAHRILGHEGKCRHLHGHRYVAEVTFAGEGLDGLGRVIDFSVVKDLIGGFINQQLDHNVLLHRDDPLLAAWKNQATIVARDGTAVQAWEMIGTRCPYVFSKNPTAENIAEELFVQSFALLATHPQFGVLPLRVRVYETPNCWADYSPDSPKSPA